MSGPAAGRQLEPTATALEFGREAGEDGRLAGDPQLSRRHARVSRFEGGRLMVEDLGSTNGTFVNGRRIEQPTLLSPGDTVAMGDTTMTVLAADEAGPAAPQGGDPIHGGVHSLPTDLLPLLISRAPVRREWIVKVALIAMPIVFAIDFLIRTVSIEYLDVPRDTHSMKLYALVIVTIGPTLGNCIGFYKNFGRPENHSVAPYLIPSLMIMLSVMAFFLILVPSGAGAAAYVVTVLIVVVAPSIVVPTLLGLRIRAELEAEKRLGAQSAR